VGRLSLGYGLPGTIGSLLYDAGTHTAETRRETARGARV